MLQLLLTLRNINFKRTGHNAHLSHAPIFILAHLHTELVLSITAQEFGARIRGYWGVENKVHYV